MSTELMLGVLLGAVASIPVGLFTNLLTPKVQAFRAKRHSDIREARLREDTEYTAAVEWLSANVAVLNTYLLSLGLKAFRRLATLPLPVAILVLLTSGAADPTELGMPRLVWFMLFLAMTCFALHLLIESFLSLGSAAMILRDVRSVAGWPYSDSVLAKMGRPRGFRPVPRIERR